VDTVKIAARLVRLARQLVADTPNMKMFERFLESVPGVSKAVVNDYTRVSDGAYSVDFHVYSKIGGKLSRTLKSKVKRFIKQNDFVEEGYSHGDWFITPRGNFPGRSYDETPYIIEVVVYDD
jgi:hypothetical protein